MPAGEAPTITSSSITELFLWDGLWAMPWWGYVLISLASTHVTIICVTLFLHRAQAHRSVRFHSGVEHFMRFWLWLTTGLNTKAWVAVHRKHHATVESPEDPHSPVHKGIWNVLFRGAELYRVSALQPEVLEQYGHGTPDDWVERRVYLRSISAGIFILLATAFVMFGWAGVAMWAVQMMWIPFFAAGVINGASHYVGYRNFDTDDTSTNLVSFGWLIGGEELHNNHHAFPSSAKFSQKWWEFDAGWLYLNVLSKLGLAEVRRMAPMPGATESRDTLDMDTVRNLLSCHLHVMSDYMRDVMQPMMKSALRRCRPESRRRLLGVKSDVLSLSRGDCARVNEALDDEAVASLKKVHELGCRLRSLWASRQNDGNLHLREALVEWCKNAEGSGLESLRNFSARIKGYTLKPSRVAAVRAG